MWLINTVEYYSVFKRKDVLTHAPTRMNPKGIMLSEKASHRGTNSARFHLHEDPAVVTCIDRR